MRDRWTWNCGQVDDWCKPAPVTYMYMYMYMYLTCSYLVVAIVNYEQLCSKHVHDVTRGH